MLPLDAPDRIPLLVAEDDPHWRTILQKSLPATALVVPDGEAALDVFARRMVGLVVTDLMMPGIGGLDLLRVVKETDPACRVIIMSAHATLDSVVDALNGGASYFWEKTRPIDELVRVIARLQEERAAEQRTRTLAADLLRHSTELARTRPEDREKALRVLVELYQGTLRALPDGIAVVDGEGHILLANAALAERLGTAPAALLGQDLATVATALPSEGTQGARRFVVAGQSCAVHVFPKPD